MDINYQELLKLFEEQYFFIQYGKLMPGFIHNINGRLTALDSKIQLNGMKVKLKAKKIEAKREELGDNVVDALKKEYSELDKLFNDLNESKKALNSLLSILNEKVSSENIFQASLIDVNSMIKSFHEFFKFYKRYKHNTKTEFDLEDNPFIKMEPRDLNFLLYAIVRNGVDAAYKDSESESYIKYTTKNYDDHVHLTIENNGEVSKDSSLFFKKTFTTKKSFGEQNISADTPVGFGSDLFFLGKILAKYPGLSYEYLPGATGQSSVFSFKLPKK